jgi:hypothetical protein
MAKLTRSNSLAPYGGRSHLQCGPDWFNIRVTTQETGASYHVHLDPETTLSTVLCARSKGSRKREGSSD